jgi:hypothetical protein
MLSKQTLTKAFAVLFEQCLRVRPDDQILLIYDDLFRPFLDSVIDFLTENKLHATFVEIPKAYQRALVSWGTQSQYSSGVPLGLAAAIGEASIILNCLDGDSQTARLRRAIVQQQRPHECRLAHIPGLSEDILEVMTRSPIYEILESAESVAWGLGEARTAELCSRDLAGTEHSLRLDLGGWDNEPLMSPGVIYPNSWGNIPPGEVFCCPDHASVNGEVCINGSVPGKCLGEGEEAVLRFSAGLLESWYPRSSPAALFLEAEKSRADLRGDENWNAFAELGIGLNSAVANLTGNPLLDEKALGTVHVAIGDNTTFGRHLKADTHLDMVVKAPTLLLDAIVLIDRGELLLDRLADWRHTAKPEPLRLVPGHRLFLNAAKVDKEQGFALRRLSSAGRVGYVNISGPTDAALLMKVLSHLSEDRPISLADLRSEIDDKDLDTALALLHHYRVLEIEKNHA